MAINEIGDMIARWYSRLSAFVDHRDGNFLARLGDKAGAKRFSLRNSDDAEVAGVDSLGRFSGYQFVTGLNDFAAGSYQSRVTFTASGSGLKWVRIRVNYQNQGGLPFHISVTRSIFANANVPYGGPSLDIRAVSREWHVGQVFLVAQYGYHGTTGAEITHCAILDNAANGYFIYLRLYGSVDYVITTHLDSGFIGAIEDDATGAPAAVMRYQLNTGLNIIGDMDGSVYAADAVYAAGEQLNTEQWRAIRFQNAWAHFNSSSSQCKYFTGVYDRVLLSGLFASGTLNTNLFNLHAGAMPAEDILISSGASSGGAIGPARIDLDDNVLRPVSGGTYWMSLDGVIFRAGQWPWISPTLQNSWASYGSSWAPAGYLIDPDGMVFVKGLIRNGTPNVAWATLPTGYRPSETHMVLGVATISGVVKNARLDINTNGTLVILPESAGSMDWVSVDRIRFPTDISNWSTPTLLNSWVNYGGGWAAAGYWKDAAGVVYLKGLIKTGTLAQPAFTLPAGYRPLKTTVVASIAHNGSTQNVAQILIDASGNVTVQEGGNSWASISGVCFRGEQ